jgi:hypothetical protein
MFIITKNLYLKKFYYMLDNSKTTQRLTIIKSKRFL